MQLIGRVVVLALCAFSAYAVPTVFVAPNGNIELLMAQLRSAFIDTRGLSPAESLCAEAYNNRSEKLNQQLTNNTNLCFVRWNNTIGGGNNTANATATQVRRDIDAVSQQLQRCLNITVADIFFTCVTDSFDANLALLDRANSASYEGLNTMVQTQVQVGLQRQNCIHAAITSSKSQLTMSANDYSACLSQIGSSKQLSWSEAEAAARPSQALGQIEN